MEKNILIDIQNISKTFGKVIANKDISLKFHSGEIHSILGENGAGKSTLMNMLSGIYTPDSGSIFVKGKRVKFSLPKDSISMGIGMIHQHFKLVDVLTAKENIIAGQKGGLFINGKKLSKEIKEISQKYGLEISPDKKVYNMSVAEKQRLEILKVLYRGADILILDEPTAVLTPQETEKLFKIIRKMKESGCCVIIITHKLNEVMEISDKITVLRKGEVIATVNKEDMSPKKLADMMVGRSLDLSIERIETKDKKTILKIDKLSCMSTDATKVLDNISFDIESGEILGVAGVAGSGQKELCEAIAGLYKVSEGEIIYKGQSIVGKNPRDIIKMGISMSFIPEDRLGMGLIASMDIVDNMLLKEYQNQKGFLLSRKSAKSKAYKIIDKLSIATPGVNHPVRKLSGGNIQKVLLGREIETNPSLIITAYPARGLDIGAAYTVYDLLNAQKKKGVGILFIGEDLDVLMELCDRIIVLCEGKITGIVKADTVTKEELGLMMAGENLQRNDNIA
ncbi:ABC transporter ATP-binding protein [Paramaledivibacter caminithermalis]|jgi:simple sugar transport system ATP-binding protein|uniref:Nucleoside ABC transporter ATP-binding protein n=1 Tax=Paramaledivibacter caminithermalis (strain DSM 15212 / CIP 107654 / DViRD3) TaxID=1121301 RepID=A0A1M6S6S6_PARC5|nr:ABC transporter ATP-binding protein [Paramaledivibacter caminithermalis]SHK40248.1 nucleoside ABC transporter ATP-binding protein [Paramaledivibacter caminithermalis DSM 15212]